VAILGSSVKGRNLPRGPSSVGGAQYSAMRCVEGGFPLERCLSHGKRQPGFGCRPRCLTGGVRLGGGRVLHMEVFLRGRRQLCSLGTVWFCATASLRGRRPLCSLGAVYLGTVGTGSLFIVLYYAFGSLMRSKFIKHNAWSYLLLRIKVGVVLAREVLNGLQLLERKKTKSIQVAFDPGGREIVSSCAQIKIFTRTY